MTSAKHISYAHAAQTRSGWAVIRVMENVTGRTRMLRRARGFQAELEQGQSFWNVMTERYGLTLDIQGRRLEQHPNAWSGRFSSQSPVRHSGWVDAGAHSGSNAW